jgi:hypothetical protein
MQLLLRCCCRRRRRRRIRRRLRNRVTIAAAAAPPPLLCEACIAAAVALALKASRLRQVNISITNQTHPCRLYSVDTTAFLALCVSILFENAS